MDDEQDTGGAVAADEPHSRAAGRSHELHIVGRADVYTDALEESSEGREEH